MPALLQHTPQRRDRLAPVPGPGPTLATPASAVATVTLAALQHVSLWIQHEPRALGVGGSPPTTENILRPTGTGATLAQATQSAAAAEDDTPDDTGRLLKRILEWAFAIAALLVVAALSLWKYNRLRRSNNRPALNLIPRPYSRAPLPGRPRIPLPSEPPAAFSPHTPLHTASGTTGTEVDNLFPVPARSRRAAHGADIDSHGRRGGARDEDDDADLAYPGLGAAVDDKDELPAYDGKGGPPKYHDVTLGTAVEMSVIGQGFVHVPGDADMHHDEERRSSTEPQPRASTSSPTPMLTHGAPEAPTSATPSPAIIPAGAVGAFDVNAHRNCDSGAPVFGTDREAGAGRAAEAGTGAATAPGVSAHSGSADTGAGDQTADSHRASANGAAPSGQPDSDDGPSANT